VRQRLAGYVRLVRAVLDRPALRLARTASRRVAIVSAVILAVAVVTSVTVDVGGIHPSVKSWVESEASKFLERPMHIGRLSFRLWTGRFVLEDIVIEGLTPESRPFLRAHRLDVAVPWSTLIDRRFVLDTVEMTDWQMHLEVRADGKHSLPKLTPRGRSSSGPRRWTTTLRWVRAHRGEFTYEDHGTPWSIVTRNLDVTVARPGSEYRGQASFSNGTVAIQSYEPFAAEMRSTFKIDGNRVVLDGIDLITDGARSRVYGDVNLAHFPEMMYRVESTIDFRRMREIFFAREAFTLSGTGRFLGHFHLFKEPRPNGTTGTGRELFGTFRSDTFGVNAYRARNLNGTVRWTPRRLAVTDASAEVFGGRSQFSYAMAPLGERGVRPTARFDAQFAGLSVQQYTEFIRMKGMRLSGNAAGRVGLEWPLGQFGSAWHLAGGIKVTPPDGVTLMTSRVPVELIEQGRLPRGPAAPLAPMIPVPIGADLAFEMGPQDIRFDRGYVATSRTYVSFEGTTTSSGERSTIPVAVSSADWQESYRVFADLRTAFDAPTSPIQIGGYGTFAGAITGNLRRPRIEGTFDGEKMRVWDVEWGSIRGRTALENGYAEVKETTVVKDGSRMAIDGRFSLGFSPRDGGEEINANIRLTDRPVADLRDAFGIDRYPIDGLLSGDFHVFGGYRSPFGFGTMEIARGMAYGEPFESATSTIGLEGEGVRLTALQIRKGEGRASGAAYVSWQGGYSFDLQSTQALPIESIARVQGSIREDVELAGLIDFHAWGSGTFTSPSYNVTGAVRDLFLNDEGIGQVNVKALTVRDDALTLDAEVASPRLDVDVRGRMELTDDLFTEVEFRVNDTSLDPYIRALNPGLSPFTTAVVSGSVNVKGDLAAPERLTVATHVSDLRLRLFDYELRNSGPFDIAFDRNVVRFPANRPSAAGLCMPDERGEPPPAIGLYGLDTKLEICGQVGLEDESLAVSIIGLANLAVLQGFVDNMRSSGTASLRASLSGPMAEPLVTGTLMIENGRIRHFGFPLALERIAGNVAFDDGGVTLDGLSGELGGGRVQFEGNIEQEGYRPGQMNVTMSSVGTRGVRVRYPQGMRSEVDIERLSLRGTVDDMRLEGEVRIIDALYDQPFPASLFALVGGDDQPPSAESELAIPLTYEGILIRAESSIRVRNSGDISARVSSSANLELRGSFDQPVLSGDMEIDRGGDITFLGKRYVITQGTVYFSNPDRIEPTVDIEAETRVRVPGETYRITANIRGTPSRLDTLAFTSDPPLRDADIWALLISDVPPGEDSELRRARGDSTTQQQALQELAAVLTTQAVSAQVNQAFERTFGVGVSIRPTLVDPSLQSARPEPGARVTIYRRLSPRAFLQYSRSVSASSADELIVLEYDATDSVTYRLSRNEDQTYAIEVSMRRSF
jgi:hypothetical protein